VKAPSERAFTVQCVELQFIPIALALPSRDLSKAFIFFGILFSSLKNLGDVATVL
jgi:hypothetical protein